jgi:signal peptidase II
MSDHAPITASNASPGPAQSRPDQSCTARSRSTPRSAAGSARAWGVLLIVAALSIGADLWSKSVAFATIADAPVVVERDAVLRLGADNPRMIGRLVPPHDAITVIPHVLDLTLVLNPGAVFGIGPGQRGFFVAFTLFAIGFGMWMFARWTGPKDHWAHAGIALVLGGGLGNLYDRLVYGCVRDFLHPLPGAKWPMGLHPFGSSGDLWPYVSNVADALLLAGIGILLVFLWRGPKKG